MRPSPHAGEASVSVTLDICDQAVPSLPPYNKDGEGPPLSGSLQLSYFQSTWYPVLAAVAMEREARHQQDWKTHIAGGEVR